MPTQVQFRRGTTAQNDAFLGANGEVVFDDQNKQLRVHDGVVVGGYKISNTDAAVFTTSVSIGNVTLTPSTVTVGNSSVNTQIVAGNVYLNGSTLVIGNTATNVTINSTSISVSGTQLNGTNFAGTANNASYLSGNTVSDLHTYSDNKAANAYSNSTAYADNKAANAYSNAIAYSGNAAQAYSNATSYADNKAANAYSNATAYADTKAANAYSNATSYADTKAATAYSNAIAYSGNAAQAYANATTFASNATNISSGTIDTARLPATANISTAINVGANVNLSTSQINIGNATVNTVITSTNITGNGANITSVNAATVGGNTASDLRTYTDNKAANAYSNAIAYSGNAAQAYSNATSYADTKAATAYSNATAYADTKSATAYTNAVSYANLTFQTMSGLNANIASYLLDGTDKVITANTITLNGNVVVNGNTDYFVANNIVYADALLEIHAPGANVANTWTFDDGKDIGFRFHYYNSGDKNAALVLADDTKYLEWYISGTENANGVFSGTYGDIKANNFYGTANNATNLNGQAASYYTNATNITTGTLPWTQAPTNTVNTSGNFTVAGVYTHNANVVFGNATVNATAFSNTTGTYFTGTAYTANNATNLGGTAAASYQLNSTLAANVATLTANLATYIVANTGLVSNATGVYVNAAYINTISANNAAYLGGLAAASYANTSAPLITTSVTVGNATVNVTVNSTSFSGTSSNATNLNSQPGSYYTNATNITTGTLPYAQIPANIINTTAAFTITGVHTHNANLAVNAATFTAGNTTQGTIANSAGLYFSSSDGTACSYMTTTAVYTPNLVSPTGNPLYLKTNGVTAVTILAASQNMGIGNAAPSHTLSINGATYLGGNAIFNSGVSANGGYGTAGQGLFSNGTGVYWATVTSGATLTANTTDNQTYYFPMANTTSGTWSNAVVDTNITFNPSTNALLAPGQINAASHTVGTVFVANTTTLNANGLVVNSTGAYVTGLTNSTSFNTGGGFGSATGGAVANVTQVGVGNTTVNTYLRPAGVVLGSQTLTDGATISWDTSLGQVATVTLGGNRAFANATNLKVGTYILAVKQDATGSRTLTWGGIYKWPAGVAPTLTTTANATDIMTFYSDGTNMYGTYINNVS